MRESMTRARQLMTVHEARSAEMEFTGMFTAMIK